MSDKEVKDVFPKLNDLHPLGRNRQALDVTSVILSWAGAQADQITGTVLPADGGVTAGQHAG